MAHESGEQEAGHYRIGYALEEAERVYEWTGGELVWRAPGDELSKGFGHEADRWAGFMKRYRAELEEVGKTENPRKIGERAAERNVTLLFGAKDTEHNNARGSRPSCVSSEVQRMRLRNYQRSLSERNRISEKRQPRDGVRRSKRGVSEGAPWTIPR